MAEKIPTLKFLNSNYTLREKHKTLSNDNTIFERDYMITTTLGGYDDSVMPYGESNFKFEEVTPTKRTRKHSDITELSKNGKINSTNSTVSNSVQWTLNDIRKLAEKERGRDRQNYNDSNKNSKTGDSNNVLNKYFGNNRGIIGKINRKLTSEHHSITDFCYYGSVEVLFKKSVENIIRTYCGELVVTDETFIYADKDGEHVLQYNDEDLYLIDNPFGIDLHTEVYYDRTNLKYMCNNRRFYKINDNENELHNCVGKWQLTNHNIQCPNNGDILYEISMCMPTYDMTGGTIHNEMIIYGAYFDGNILYFTTSEFIGFKITPIKRVTDYYYDNLNDFEYFLLNSETIEELQDTEYGLLKKETTLKWPRKTYNFSNNTGSTYTSINLDCDSALYSSYINRFLNNAHLYDEYYTNNLWRMMVHDSIKNMDLTYERSNSDESQEDYIIGITKLHEVFDVIALLFDEIKRNIDNIKQVKNCGYSTIGKIPEMEIVKTLTDNGWNIISPTLWLPISRLINSNDEISQCNKFFYETLRTNSKDILSKKGTRAGVEMMLSLFGIPSKENKDVNDIIYFTLDEKICVVKNNELTTPVDYNEENISTIKYNSLVKGISPLALQDNPLYGLMARIVSFIDESNKEKMYLIPWHEKDTFLYGNTYYQMYGGWGKLNNRIINLPNLTDKRVIESEDGFYSENMKYLEYIPSINDLLNIPIGELYDNKIYYVENITDNLPNVFKTYKLRISNYFIIKNKDKCTEFSKDGWWFIPKQDIREGKNDGLKVLYLESLIDEKSNNRPHIGYSHYDDGEEYINRYRQLFKPLIDIDTKDNPSFENDAYDCDYGSETGGTINEDILNNGFKINDLNIDNHRVWFFKNMYLDESSILKPKNEEEDYTLHIGQGAYEKKEVKGYSDFTPINFENKILVEDEASSYSIINTKVVEITFYCNNEKMINDFHIYVQTTVIPYLEQILPATIILKYSILNDDLVWRLSEEWKDKKVWHSLNPYSDIWMHPNPWFDENIYNDLKKEL